LQGCGGTEIDSTQQLSATFCCLVLLDVALAVLEHLHEAFGEKLRFLTDLDYLVNRLASFSSLTW